MLPKISIDQTDEENIIETCLKFKIFLIQLISGLNILLNLLPLETQISQPLEF